MGIDHEDSFALSDGNIVVLREVFVAADLVDGGCAVAFGGCVLAGRIGSTPSVENGEGVRSCRCWCCSREGIGEMEKRDGSG